MRNRLLKFNIKKVVFISIYLILFAVAFLWLSFQDEGIEYISKQPDSIDYLIENIYNDVECVQYFEVPGNSTLEFISVQFATYYDTVETSGVVFMLYGDDEMPLYVTDINAEDMNDNAHYTISFNYPIKTKSGKYHFTITGTDENNGKVTPAVWGSKYDDTSTALYIDGEKQEYNINAVYKYSEPNTSYYIHLALQFVLCIVFICIPLIYINKKPVSVSIKIVLFLLNIILTEWITENAGISKLDLEFAIRGMTCILILCIQMVILGLCGNVFISIITTNIFFTVITIANCFVMTYRGNTVVPSDIFGLGTLAAVVGNYRFSVTCWQLLLLIWVYLWSWLNVKLLRSDRCHLKWSRNKKTIFKKAAAAFVMLAVGIGGVYKLCDPDILKNQGITYYVWDRNQGYYKNGPVMNFMANMQFAFLSKPEGYTKEATEKYLAEYETDDNETTAEETVQPNVIVIMNESFADFSFYNTSLEYSEDPLSFIHSMTENTVKGKCYVSVFGGLTANSEMEALTGHTMAFFPTGTVIYEQFRQSNISGMAEYFNNLGYRSIAMHPNLATNWSRDKVYESMGFDEFYSQADFENPEYVRWISDKSTYDKIIELYENKNEDEQLFVFDVTMQGHGGYYTQTNWEHPVTLESADYSYTDEYLSSTYVSDKAFQYLIEYFEQQEEPTLIFMFGDHQPQLQTGFHELLLGKSQAELTLEETQQKYVTPFVLWTNYEIESKDDTEISTNQISSVVKENAGLKLTSYEKFIQSFSEHIPLINQNGYQDTDGVWHSFDEEGNEEDNEWLKKYEWIQYGIYCDGIEVK